MDRRLAAALAALLLAAAPAAVRAEEEANPAPAAPVEAAKPAETDDEALQRMTGEMMKKIEEIRGLKFKQDVKRVWKTREEAREEMLREIDEQAAAEDLASASKAMGFFGLIKEGGDLKTIFSEFISAAAGGYYLPKKKVFSLVRGFNENANRPIVFHELVHAVEDQYFDYQERTERYQEEKRSDPAEALHALVEGSARHFENIFVDSEPGLRAKYMQAQMEESMKQMAALMKAPPALVISVGMFPYENGAEFLGHVLPRMVEVSRKAGFTEIDALAAIYADPPMSTEQILHPEKYLGARDMPQAVELPDVAAVLGEGWKESMQDTMGEFSTGLVLNAILLPNVLPAQAGAVMNPPSQAVKFRGETATAVTGWDGDRYGIYEKGDALCLAWHSAWDSARDAGEFAATYAAVLGKKYRVPSAEKAADDAARARVAVDMELDGWKGKRFPDTRGASSAVLFSGNRVIVAERVPADRLEPVLKALAGAKAVQDPEDSLPAIPKPPR